MSWIDQPEQGCGNQTYPMHITAPPFTVYVRSSLFEGRDMSDTTVPHELQVREIYVPDHDPTTSSGGRVPASAMPLNAVSRDDAVKPARLNLLLIEDSADDAALVTRTLTLAGYEVSAQQVYTEDSLRTALGERLGSGHCRLHDAVVHRHRGSRDRAGIRRRPALHLRVGHDWRTRGSRGDEAGRTTTS